MSDSDPLRSFVHTVVDSRAMQAAVNFVAGLLPASRLYLTRHTVIVRNLPEQLDGLRLLHVSDLHVHPGSDLAWQLPEIARNTPHDLIVYTGDFIDVDSDIPAIEQLLARMPREVPALAVLGNHDYIPHGRQVHGRPVGANDIDRLVHVLEASGLDVLRNESRTLFDGGLTIAGADDPSTLRDDTNLTFSEVKDDAATVLLAHSPDIALRLGHAHPGLILAGHTHGGQIRLPLIGALLTLTNLPRHLAMGLGSYQDIPIFVSRGIGYSGLHVRIGSPAEVTLMTLRAASQAVRRSESAATVTG